jgi:hypothetical protein
MDVVLAVVVVVLIIMFGALLTRGNALLSNALSDLNTLARDWAIEDLKIKKAKLAKTTKMPDSKAWVGRILKKVTGDHFPVSQIQSPGQRISPEFLNVVLSDGRRVVLCIGSPEMLRKMRSERHRGAAGRLAEAAGQVHPLIPYPKNAATYQLDDLSCGVEFDAEAKLVWKSVMKEDLVVDRLWAYVLPAKKE